MLLQLYTSLAQPAARLSLGMSTLEPSDLQLDFWKLRRMARAKLVATSGKGFQAGEPWQPRHPRELPSYSTVTGSKMPCQNWPEFLQRYIWIQTVVSDDKIIFNATVYPYDSMYNYIYIYIHVCSNHTTFKCNI